MSLLATQPRAFTTQVGTSRPVKVQYTQPSQQFFLTIGPRLESIRKESDSDRHALVAGGVILAKPISWKPKDEEIAGTE